MLVAVRGRDKGLLPLSAYTQARGIDPYNHLNSEGADKLKVQEPYGSVNR